MLAWIEHIILSCHYSRFGLQPCSGGWGASCRFLHKAKCPRICFLGGIGKVDQVVESGLFLDCFWDSPNDATVTSCLMERFELPRARPFSSHSDTAVHAMSRTGMHRFLRKKRVLLWNFSCGSLSFVSWPWRLVRFGWIMSCYTSLVTTMDCFSYIASRQFISWPFLPLVPWPACIAASLS
jgi:hypothetical protein